MRKCRQRNIILLFGLIIFFASRLRILKLCQPSQEVQNIYKDWSQDFAQRGFRSLGVAVKEEGQSWQCLGLLPMSDPPREDTASVGDLNFVY